MTDLVALAAPGLGPLFLQDLELRSIATSQGTVRPLRNHDFIQFSCEEAPKRVLESRLAEDLFVVLGTGFPAKTASDLKRTIPRGLRERILQGLPLIAAARKQKKTTNFAVFVKQDKDYELFRKTLAAPLIEFLSTNFKHWVPREPADIELWYFVLDGVGTLGLRLTNLNFRKRVYRSEDRPGALRPTIASALVVVSKPAPFDYVLDPMCGSGTIVIERGLAGPALEIHANDIDEEAVAITSESAKRAGVAIQVSKMDALSDDFLHRHHGKVTNLLCNLPFGRQFSNPEAIDFLYRRALGSWKDLLSSGGTMTLLVHDPRALRDAARSVELRSSLIEQWRIKGVKASAVRIWR